MASVRTALLHRWTGGRPAAPLSPWGGGEIPVCERSWYMLLQGICGRICGRMHREAGRLAILIFSKLQYIRKTLSVSNAKSLHLPNISEWENKNKGVIIALCTMQVKCGAPATPAVPKPNNPCTRSLTFLPGKKFHVFKCNQILLRQRLRVDKLHQGIQGQTFNSALKCVWRLPAIYSTCQYMLLSGLLLQ